MRLLPTLFCGAVVGLSLLTAPVALADDQLAASMCDYVAADDKNRLRKVLSDYRLRLRNIYDGVVCNGESLIRHAFKSNAADVGEFIVKQLPGSAVAGSGDIAWAEANGFAASPLLAVLKSRAGEGD
ncbi:DUF3718 domain-containing protein [Rheinheimera nanhaiensis]|uniref:DUF3718 domain-containing protein n=1 Tax=Rheinheimera nanhaiensis E407-8 TaxID=562729 RepID=I1DXU3_9GAMM|nr:DUF3718 domain-containing protein [Rheinheimera nanhaiensis]GAB58871.1 hypothetical protein RNAN_1859 [Rheinheimera nanhaiensis E407-8]